MLLLQILVISCVVVVSTFSIPVPLVSKSAEAAKDISKSTAQSHPDLGQLADEGHAIPRNKKPSEFVDNKPSEIATLSPGTSSTNISSSKEVAQVANESKQASALKRLTGLIIPDSSEEAFWRYVPASLSGVTCFSLHYLFPGLFEAPNEGFPFFGVFLSVLPATALNLIRPSDKTAKSVWNKI
ncbi:hypothetical protein PTTG_27590 [Puccinia triticina 1-1 BBBD Race 1]|uniref:Uncharacterized protein n=2 Tax=Puccinia triticina TaxID=208348 RepID=A0A180GIS8_PUCT1|nr:uncharacterized protein PtA15_2A815 [Puccinia triticina]OAV92677.1 hypothetical protein PTTG_27590 [Puccinia triticina 1-1 BBBD Race 1]WAQ82498.1 hypothetical protein PtA15_2A815 [Puccinia triticina]WAR53351.1 hypothetical protein PtB15_2B782 [Puccinia triticina]